MWSLHASVAICDPALVFFSSSLAAVGYQFSAERVVGFRLIGFYISLGVMEEIMLEWRIYNIYTAENIRLSNRLIMLSINF